MLNGDSFKLNVGLQGLQSCGWFLKHSITTSLTESTNITKAIMRSTEALQQKKCILYDPDNLQSSGYCDDCCLVKNTKGV
jgi:hypothetical protein